MLEIKNLTKTLDGTEVLRNINLTLEPGEIFGLLGRNGSGKTTLLRCIQTIIQADEGEIKFENCLIEAYPLIKRKVIYVPVHTPFYDRYTYKQLIRILRNIYPDFDVTYANELMNRYGLPETKKYRELSTGLKKQMALILAFAVRPAVILLDEPTDGIDAVTRHDLMQLMIDEVANRNTTILITSHRLEDIERICNRIAFLEEETLSNVINVEELKEDYVKVQLAFEEDVQLKIREKGIPILESSGVFYTVILKRDDLANSKWLESLTPKIWNELPVNLEEVFIARFGGKRRW
ncbi:antibiotic ABC transporter ATP-binding protein [Bacillus sp. SA1-12]|uniref:ABC transporter ATP-binding protein n=1 Tax=Bacillus sp. SA1-12 TaxID=1455638 RepID=UPI0006271389|nr:ABC transporter ATP-binding protein [Bacillus sp. SA1-12]KKI88845.1 antibiotic ABC transporter ATP-binding protein [Bacillus sp. SA1-12]